MLVPLDRPHMGCEYKHFITFAHGSIVNSLSDCVALELSGNYHDDIYVRTYCPRQLCFLGCRCV